MTITELIKSVHETNADIGSIYIKEAGTYDGKDVCVAVAFGDQAKALKKWHQRRSGILRFFWRFRR
jgi:hypothetical protein